MKYLKLTGYNTNKSHLVPANAIAGIEFEDDYTTINLINGYSINVIETELSF